MKGIDAGVSILLNYLLYIFLERYEALSCECSYDIRKDVLKTMILVFYFIIFGDVMFSDIPNVVRWFVGIFVIVFDIIMLTYLNKLRNNDCECNSKLQNIGTTVLYWYYLILVFLIAFSITMFFLYKLNKLIKV
jgi:hypothetical protein